MTPRHRTTTMLTLAAAAMVTLIGATAAQAATTFTGAVDGDINNAGNWSAGIPSSANLGTVPTGHATIGNPRDKFITYQGTSSYSGNAFGGGNANGYDVTFNGTGSSNMTGNGLFLAWDGGAANESSFAWNSTGTLDTTRFFIGRFGVGNFSQSAGVFNQTGTGTFSFVLGELNGSQGSSYALSGGTLNATARMEARRGSFDQSGGTANFNHAQGINFGDGNTFAYNLSGGTVVTNNLIGFNANDAIDFSVGGTGVLQVLNSNLDVAGVEGLITSNRITLGGAPALVTDFTISVVDIEGSDYTQVSTVIPEPSTLTLAALALLGLLGWGRRRRRS